MTAMLLCSPYVQSCHIYFSCLLEMVSEIQCLQFSMAEQKKKQITILVWLTFIIGAFSALLDFILKISRGLFGAY